jgi:hypothetical protein
MPYYIYKPNKKLEYKMGMQINMLNQQYQNQTLTVITLILKLGIKFQIKSNQHIFLNVLFGSKNGIEIGFA